MSSHSSLGESAANLRHKNVIERQRETVQTVVQRLLASPISAFLTVAVIAISLTLPAIFFASVSSLQELANDWRADTRLTVYLDPASNDALGDKLAQSIQDRDDVASTTFIGKAQAAQDLSQWIGDQALIDNLPSNTLPGAIIVLPDTDLASATALQKLGDELNTLQGVESVDADVSWLQRLTAILGLLGTGVSVIALLLALAIIAIVAKSTHLDMLNRQSESKLCRLVGATERYIRKPFVYTGALYGFAGGVVASVLTALALALLNGPINDLATEYQSSFTLSGLGFSGALILIALSTTLGFIGAWLATHTASE